MFLHLSIETICYATQWIHQMLDNNYDHQYAKLIIVWFQQLMIIWIP